MRIVITQLCDILILLLLHCMRDCTWDIKYSMCRKFESITSNLSILNMRWLWINLICLLL